MDGPTYGEHSSPDLEKFKDELKIPEERAPDGKRRGADYHEISVEETTHSFHSDLDDTTIWGFDGQFPGPVLTARKGERLAVEFDNSGMPDEHLFNVDTNVEGTTSENYVGYDSPVPEVRTVTHFHGLKVDPANDGQAEMWTSPDGVEGPRFVNAVQELPNRQDRLTTMYHDHARGISRLNNYAGLVGPYRIKSKQEDEMNLPDGEYDVPLVLADRSFTDDGELFYPSMFMANVAGDVATVNGTAWPNMEVEPRKYRFHIINVSNGRTYDLGLDNDDEEAHGGPALHQISAGHGFLEEVVSIGHHGDMESLVLAPFERAEVIVDFSEYAGETFTVTNGAMFPYNGDGGHDDGGHDMNGMDMGDGDDDMDHGDDDMDHGEGGMGHGDMDHPMIHEIMQFRVTDDVSEPDTTADPATLRLPNRKGPDPNAAKTTRKVTMEMGMDDNGLMIHTLNGKRWSDPIEYKPQLGSTEIWELENTDDHTHPIHLHLVEFDVIDRERHHSHDDPQPPEPNERGGVDVVKVNPGETVRIAVKFDTYTGKFPFHCHVLEHEEHDMMRMFEVVSGNSSSAGRGRETNSGNN
ncbi:multicopper oxidase family protein [Natronosalvus rutilus]|uniref:Multicopper oxidase domain-containing protein n=1 Tax=Natronosalvus rutilus TaxID=2953753 RepID=A0A9E7ND94_9EURY|nr:multicopper oxidase domain-containing protein [Natronosalvus rutilus]UTF54845.1 multicopper oxidase domain-containing protein [Natronosalvus rutilus]